MQVKNYKVDNTMKNVLNVFPVGNGDSTLIEADNLTILTDINYRKSLIDKDEAYDFAPDLRKACKQNNDTYLLDIFVLTHPDQDHLGGLTEIFYTGVPDNYVVDENDESPLILISEIWVSPYSVDPNYETDASKPVIKEIKRRKKLMGTDEGEKDGNRLCILDTDEETEGSITDNINWTLLAPTSEEAKIEDTDDDETHASSNNSSLVIKWKIKVAGKENCILLGADAEVDIWERIWEDNKDDTDNLAWHILLAPHHCSRNSMARKNEDTEEYEYSDDALNALGVKIDDGFIISSSKPVKNNNDNPPSWDARKKYIDILSSGNNDKPKERFLNPESHKNNKAATVVFQLTSDGPSLDVAKSSKSSEAILTGGFSSSSTYGSE